MELFVIRHGITEWNHQKKIQGQLDTELSEIGRQQAKALAARLAQVRAKAIYSSDLKRAQQTAQEIAAACGLELVLDDRLRERNMGVIQGMRWEEVKEEYPEIVKRMKSADPTYRIPDGESTEQVIKRVERWLANITRAHAGGTVIAVTHGGVLNVLFRLLLGLPPGRFRRLKLFNASLNRFVRENGKWYLVTWGDICHLRQVPGE